MQGALELKKVFAMVINLQNKSSLIQKRKTQTSEPRGVPLNISRWSIITTHKILLAKVQYLKIYAKNQSKNLDARLCRMEVLMQDNKNQASVTD